MDLGVAPWTQEIRTRIVNFLQGDFASQFAGIVCIMAGEVLGAAGHAGGLLDLDI